MTMDNIPHGEIRGTKRKCEEEIPWCLIESEPAIFTEMAHTYGATGIAVEEVYDLDFLTDGNIYGLIFTHPYEGVLPAPKQGNEDAKDASNIFFTCQIVTNMCATLALLGILFNIDHQINIGNHLSDLKNILRDVDPVLRGNALGNDKLLRETHNSFADAQARANAEGLPEKMRKGKNKRTVTDEDAYHYVSFVFQGGYIWELDGMNKFPCKVAPAEPTNWIDTLRPILRKRMDEHGMFSLMSVVPGPWVTPNEPDLTRFHTIDSSIRKQLAELNSQQMDQNLLDKPLLSVSSTVSADELVSAYARTAAIHKLERLRGQLNREKLQLTASSNGGDGDNRKPTKLQLEAAKELAKTRWENTRRKHDYTDFVRTLFEKLHKHDMLCDLIEAPKH